MSPANSRRRIPEATVARLPVYHRNLSQLRESEVATVSSEQLADLAGVNAAKVRKDLSYLGSYGTRGVGYEVEYLLFQMDRELGLADEVGVVIVGLGNLGQALANYAGFGARGFPVAALVDNSEAKVGTVVHGHDVRHLRELDQLVQRYNIGIGVIATPADAAQDVVDRLVHAGVRSILNFAPMLVSVPDDVTLRKVDLALELQILGFYNHRETVDVAAEA